MRAYYERRAAEYDDWWEGTGRFAGRERPGWDDERDALRALLRRWSPARTLDVACGTGYLARSLPRRPDAARPEPGDDRDRRRARPARRRAWWARRSRSRSPTARSSAS